MQLQSDSEQATEASPARLAFGHCSHKRTIVQRGDTRWLRVGTSQRTFVSTAAETAAAIIRYVSGGRAIIDGGESNGTDMWVGAGNNSWFWEFEVFSSSRKLVGGGSVAQNITFLDNYTYGSVTNVGYGAPVVGLTMTDNYLATDSNTLELNATNVTMNGNTYIGGPTNDISGFKPSSFPNNAYVMTRPKGVNVIVRPSYYVRSRANVVIYNWDQKNSVAVDLSRVLKRGDLFEIRDVQNFFGPPIAVGTYTGSPVTIPMRAPIHVAKPIGDVRVKVPNTRPQFGVFVVLLRAK